MSAYRSLILSHTPYAYWPHHEAAGATSVSDVSGNARNSASGTAPTFGGTAYWIDPDEPRSAEFSGTTMGFVAPWAQSAMTDSWTIELWCRPTQTITLQTESTSGTIMTSGTNRYVFYADQGAANTAGAGLSVGTNGVCSYEHTASYAPCLGRVPATILTDRLTHIALRMTSKTHVIFINGAKDTRATSGKTSVYAPIRTVAASGTGLSNSGFNGTICEMAWYNAALTDAQIQSHYNAGLLYYSSLGKVSY